MADNQYEARCGHCSAKFRSPFFLATKVCDNCFQLGHCGNGGDCWKCRQVSAMQTDEAKAAIDEEDD